MKRKKLAEILEMKMLEFERREWTLEEIESLPTSSQHQIHGECLQISINFLEYLSQGNEAHLGISVDDMGFVNSVFPVSSSFIVKVSGNQERVRKHKI